MTPRQKSELRWFAPETLLYGVLVAAFCLGAVHWLGGPLVTLFHQRRIEYAFLALFLMVAQGFVLERLAHAACDFIRRRRKAPP